MVRAAITAFLTHPIPASFGSHQETMWTGDEVTSIDCIHYPPIPILVSLLYHTPPTLQFKLLQHAHRCESY
jgi:hypothetical protein